MRSGEPLFLECTLWDFDDTKYVRASIEADGVPLTQITVPNVGNGIYRFFDENSLVFPSNTYQVDIRYEVFQDSGFTSRSHVHAPAAEVFRLSTTVADPVLISKLDQILVDIASVSGMIQASTSGETSVSGLIDSLQQSLIYVSGISDSVENSAEILDSALRNVQNDVVGEVSVQRLVTGTIEKPEELNNC